MYLGRHIGLPVALEGALKLKEISYIATDAYAAGEMKHGPIALLDQDTPVVVVATDSPVREKLVSNIQEVRVRGARVIAIATEGDAEIAEHADEVIWVPRTALDARAAARGDPAAAARVPHRPLARAQRRPAAQPGQDRHRRVTAPASTGRRGTCAAVPGVGLDLLEIDRLERALARRPRLSQRLFTEGERAYAAARARPGQHLAARFCAKEAVAKALGLERWEWREVEVVSPPRGGVPEVVLHGAGGAGERAGRRRGAAVAHPYPRAGGAIAIIDRT